MRPYDKPDSYSGGYINSFVFVSKDGENMFYTLDNNDLLGGFFYNYEKSLTN